MNERGRIIDWQEAHARLERARKAMQTGGELSPEEVARILRSRTRALAAPLKDTTPSTKMLQLLVFTLSGERFGIETAHVLEAISLRELIPVPCTPTFVVGVTHYRGRILTVLDLRPLLNLPEKNRADCRTVISAEAGGMTFGVVADTVTETLAIPAHTVAPPPEALTGFRRAVTRGVTEELITVLDLGALAQTQEIVVNENVG